MLGAMMFLTWMKLLRVIPKLRKRRRVYPLTGAGKLAIHLVALYFEECEGSES